MTNNKDFRAACEEMVRTMEDLLADYDLEFAVFIEQLPITEKDKTWLAKMYDEKGKLERNNGKMICALKMPPPDQNSK